MGAWLDRWMAGSVLMLLPSASVIARTLTLPTAATDRLAMALRLQVENVLLGGTPRHRAGAGLLAATEGQDDRHALLVEWPQSSAVPDVPNDLPPDLNVTYAPGIAALAALGSGRPRSLMVDLDRESGCIGIALHMGQAITFRVIREDGSDQDAWRESARRAIAETLLLAGVDDSDVASMVEAAQEQFPAGGSGLIAPGGPSAGELSAMVAGTSAEAGWWHRWGLLVGAGLASASELAPTVQLRAVEARTSGGLLTRMIERCSEPKAATVLVASAIAAVALLPLGVAGLRVAVLGWKLPDPQAYERLLQRADQQAAMYREYQRFAWPMTKLLGDLASTTPEGIELESVSVAFGSPMTISGAAKPQGTQGATDAILMMERQMRDSGIFDRVVKNWEAPNAAGIVKFTITASVTQPVQMPDYPEVQDFAKRTLRDRRYGTDSGSAVASSSPAAPSTPTAPPPSAGGAPVVAINPPGTPPRTPDAAPTTPPADSGTTTASATEGRTRRGFGSAANDAATRGSSRPASGEEVAAIPDALTDEQIKSMSKAEANEALARVSRARAQKNLDPAVEQRLKDEFYKLINHQKTAK
jgi:Tfp pilus assembly protein PilN